MKNQSKECTKCHNIKPIIEFQFRKDQNQYRTDCKLCQSKHKKEWYKHNTIRVKQQVNNWQLLNQKRKYETSHQYYLNNKEKLNTQSNQTRKQRRLKNPIPFAQYQKYFRQTNLQYRIKTSLSALINRALKGNYKSGHSVDYLGHSIKEDHQFIESQFYTSKLHGDMTWDKRGKGRGHWQIHHICPLEFFNMNDPIEQKQAFHYTNTKPLWYEDHCEEHRMINERKRLLRF